ncbi:hypothetical protein MLD38_019099 [Melastoma candidum]|uniref:Uncharacterized protein n=1 Tax=Melastoma candidum TaxID=119954 RepID=A0ACB9QZD7_9MYRT|nr:hypothetical protein MLD38_019099 [Melastoma candidum]
MVDNGQVTHQDRSRLHPAGRCVRSIDHNGSEVNAAVSLKASQEPILASSRLILTSSPTTLNRGGLHRARLAHRVDEQSRRHHVEVVVWERQAPHVGGEKNGCGWSFWKRLTQHRVLNNSAVPESPVQNKKIPECIDANNKATSNLDTTEKVSFIPCVEENHVASQTVTPWRSHFIHMRSCRA